MSPATVLSGPVGRRDGKALAWVVGLGALALLFHLPFTLAFFRELLAQGESRNIVNVDFINYWMAGQLIGTGEFLELFDQKAYMARLTAAFGTEYPVHNWGYPPQFLLFMWPLGWMPYKAGLVAFVLCTFALFVASAWVFRRNLASEARWSLVVGALVPYALITTLATQNGFMTSAALLFGLAWMKQRPALAGLAFACLTVKPQLGFLVPVLLVLDRNWRVIGWSAFFSGLLFALSIAAFGVESWAAYFSRAVPYQHFVMTSWGGSFLNMMPTAFGGIRALGLPVSLASGAQLAMALCGLALFLWLLARETDPLRRVFITVCSTFVITPYAFNYDMGALTVISALLASTSSASSVRMSAVAIAMLPALVPLLARAGVPVASLILAVGLVIVFVHTLRPVSGSTALPGRP